MSYIRGIGLQQFKVEDDGRMYTMTGIEVDPETLEIKRQEPKVPVLEPIPEVEVIVEEIIEPGKYKCEVCGRDDFKLAVALSGHMRSHKKEVV